MQDTGLSKKLTRAEALFNGPNPSTAHRKKRKVKASRSGNVILRLHGPPLAILTSMSRLSVSQLVAILAFAHASLSSGECLSNSTSLSPAGGSIIPNAACIALIDQIGESVKQGLEDISSKFPQVVTDLQLPVSTSDCDTYSALKKDHDKLLVTNISMETLSMKASSLSNSERTSLNNAKIENEEYKLKFINFFNNRLTYFKYNIEKIKKIELKWRSAGFLIRTSPDGIILEKSLSGDPVAFAHVEGDFCEPALAARLLFDVTDWRQLSLANDGINEYIAFRLPTACTVEAKSLYKDIDVLQAFASTPAPPDAGSIKAIRQSTFSDHE